MTKRSDHVLLAAGGCNCLKAPSGKGLGKYASIINYGVPKHQE